jgi:hypothetical protein
MVDIVTIGYRIQTEGLAQANKEIDGLLKKSDKLNNTKVSPKTDSKGLDDVARASAKATKELSVLQKQKENLEKGFNKSTSLALARMQVAGVPPATIASYANARKQVDELSNSMSRLRVSTQGGLSLISGLGIGLGTAVFGQLAVGVGKLADSMTLLQARIKLVTPVTENLNAVQQRLVDTAIATRTDLTSTITLYNRLQPALSRYGKTTSEVLDITEAFGRTLLLSGANTREASAAILQFSQAMGSGKLAGDR